MALSHVFCIRFESTWFRSQCLVPVRYLNEVCEALHVRSDIDKSTAVLREGESDSPFTFITLQGGRLVWEWVRIKGRAGEKID